MAKKDKYEFEDDFDFNDEFSWDDEGGFDSPSQSNNRKAITAFKGTFVSGVKDTLFSEQFQEQTISRILPQSYADTYGELSNLKQQADQLKYQVGSELDKHTKQFRKDNNATIKKLTSKMPSSISSRVNRWADNFDTPYTPVDLDALNTESMLSDVFGASAQIANDYQTKAAMETTAQNKLQTGLANNTNDLLFGMGTNIGKLVGYQDNIGIKYQRKMVELSYKQLLTGRKHLDVSEKLLALQTKSNEALIKNTGLPDVVKMHNSEIAMQTIKQRFIGSVTDPMFKSTSQIAGRVSEKITGKIKDSLTGNGVGDILSQSLQFLLPEDGGYDDPTGMSTSEKLALILGGQAGNGVVNSIVGKVAPGLRDRLSDNSSITRNGAMLENLRLRAPGLAKDALARGETGFDRLDRLIRFFDLGDLRENENNLIQSSPETSLARAEVFDLQAKRTLIDVIPGLLGRIHSEMRRFNGDENHGLVKYDWKMGGFSEEQTLDDRFVREMVAASEPLQYKQAEASILKAVDPDNKLSRATRDKIARQVSISTMIGEPVSLQNFLDPSSPHYIKEFADFIENQYSTKMQYNSNGSTKSSTDFIKEASEDFLKIDNQLQREVNNLRGMSESGGALEQLLIKAEQGDISTLTRYPFIKRDTNGTYRIDYAAYYDYMNKQSSMGPAAPNAPINPGGPTDGSRVNPHIDYSRRGALDSRRLAGPLDNFSPISQAVNRADNSIDSARKRVIDNGFVLSNKVRSATKREKVNALLTLLSDDKEQISEKQYEGIVSTFEGTSAPTLASRAVYAIGDKAQAGAVYVKGEDSPRLDATSMRLGKYRLASTGAVIKSLNDITGDIIDNTGKVLLTRQHAMEGIYDQSGRKLDWDGISTNVRNFGSKVLSSFTLGGIKEVTLNKFPKELQVNAGLLKKRIGTWRDERDVQSMLSVSALKATVQQTEKLDNIARLLKEQVMGGRFSFNDRDKDGDRDGSWKDILQQRLERRKKGAGDIKAVVAQEKEKKKGFLSKLLGFIPSLLAPLGGLFSKAFGFAIPAITALFGGAIRLAIPAALGALGLKWLANKWLNRGGDGSEVIAPDDPRLDPNSPMYDPNIQVSEPGFMDKVADKVKNAGLVPRLIGGYAAIKGGMWLAKKGVGAATGAAAGAAAWGAKKLLGGVVAGAGASALGGTAAGATASLNAALAARAAARGGASGGLLGGIKAGAGMIGRLGTTTGIGTAAKLMGKTALRSFLGPIGLAWLTYDVVKYGYTMYKKHSDDGMKLNRFRLAGYGYHHKDKEPVSKLFALEGELVKHVGMKQGFAYLKDSITQEQVMGYFNVNKDDAASVQQWNQYFFGRFMPVFLSFATAMHEATNRFEVFDMDTVLDPAQQLRACDQVFFSRGQGNPYDIMTSGFLGAGELEMNKDKVTETYKLIRGTLEVKARNTRGTYLKETEVKDEKTRATRAKQIEQLNKKDGITLDNNVNKVSTPTAAEDRIDKMFGSGMVGRALASVTKSVMAGPTNQTNFMTEAGAWTRDKIGGLFGGAGKSPIPRGVPGKGWTPVVAEAVQWGAQQLGIDPNYLAAVISYETGGTFSPATMNKGSSATGLIQLMNYGDGLPGKLYYGHTRQQFAALSHMDQMQYVVKYFKMKGLKPGASLGQIYDAVTGTGYARSGKGKASARAYNANKSWDANKDGYIAPGESVTSGYFKDHIRDYFGQPSNTPVDKATRNKASNLGSIDGIGTPSPVRGATTAERAARLPPGGGVLAVVKPKGELVRDILNKGSAKNARADNQTLPAGGGVLKAGNTAAPSTTSQVVSGTKPYKAAQYVRKHGLKGSTGYCARYVRRALQEGGGYSFTGVVSAYMYHTQNVLASAGFVQIAGNSKWQIGDVMVFNRNSAHIHGHIQIWDGRNWISDFIQPRVTPYSKSCPPFSLWRDRNFLAGAASGKGWYTSDVSQMGSSGGGAIGTESEQSGSGGSSDGGVPRPKWTQKKAILGGDALWAGVSRDGKVKSAKADKEMVRIGAGSNDTAQAQNAKPDTEVTSKNPAGSMVDGGGVSSTISAKSAEAKNVIQPSAREDRAAAETQKEIARKEKDVIAKQARVKEQAENETSILKQQLQVQLDTLTELRGLRQDIVGIAQTTLKDNQSIKEFIKNTKDNSSQAQGLSKPAMAAVQAPKKMIEPVSMLKS